MLVKFMVFQEVYNRWPGKGKRRAGESFDLLLVDMSQPSEHALQELHSYRMTEDEVVRYWGSLTGKLVEIGVTAINNGERRALFRGSIVKVLEDANHG